MIEGILCLVAIIYTWNFWSKVQKNSGLVIFSTLTNYFAFKLFLCIATCLVVAKSEGMLDEEVYNNEVK